MQTFYWLNKSPFQSQLMRFNTLSLFKYIEPFFNPYILPLQENFWHFAIIVHINIVNSQKVYTEIVSPRTYHVFAPTGFHVV